MTIEQVQKAVTDDLNQLVQSEEVQAQILDEMVKIADANQITFDRDAMQASLAETLGAEINTSAVTNVDPDTVDSGDGLGAGVIVGIVIGSLAGVALLVFFFIFMQSRMKR